MKEIPLTRGQVALVDDEDFERVSRFKWRYGLVHGMRYAIREDWNGSRRRRKTVYLHRFILNTPDDFDTDHRNGDGLNNQKWNLRTCNGSQNMANRRLGKNNTSGFKGVSFYKLTSRWTADLAGRRLGYFPTAKEAARAYDRAARAKFGAFALTNKQMGVL